MSYCMPTMNEIVDRAGQSNIISKLDLAKRFHQIPVKDQDKDKTTIVSPVGKFKYQRMPFGLRNAPAIFQQMIERALEGCGDFAKAYIDDIIVFFLKTGHSI